MAVVYDNRLPDPETGATEVLYRLPFKGAWTVLNGGVTQETSHSWDVWTQRYAYDFVICDEKGSRCSGDPLKPESYLCYGADVLAPAAGVVVDLHDRNVDTLPAVDGKINCEGDDIRGNYIVIRHAEAEFSCLAHLLLGSLTVEIGESVACGQKVACCGNSGNSSEPHLHFHVQAGESFYSSPGVPIRFHRISFEPAPSYAAIDQRPVQEDTFECFPPFITQGMRVQQDQSPEGGVGGLRSPAISSADSFIPRWNHTSTQPYRLYAAKAEA